jgi:DNA-binding transcriptional MerR regulator
MPDSQIMRAAAEVSYRQLDWWTRQGYLRADNPAPGTGNARIWSRQERDIAQLMQRLAGAGLTVAKAAKVARWAVTNAAEGRAAVRIAPGIALVVEGDPL